MSYKNDVNDCLMALLSMNTSIDKVDQVISVVLSKLTKKKKDIEGHHQLESKLD